MSTLPKKFSKDEDAKILQGVMEFGAENWTEIVAWAELADRTEKAVKARYKRLLKKQAKMESLQASETESTLSAELQPWPTATIQQVETPKKQSADTELQNDRPLKRLKLDDITKQNLTTGEQKKLFQQFIDTEYSELLKQKKRLEEMEKEITRRAEEQRLKMQKVLIEMITHKEEAERREARRISLDNTEKYGRMDINKKVDGDGARYTEVWRDGKRAAELKKREAHLDKKKEQLKQRRLVLRKQKDGDFNAEFEAKLLKEVAGTVSIEEKELAQKWIEHSIAQNLHFREIKRIRDEDNSKFNHFPVLHNRYILTKLLGKGGFSEVYKAYDLLELREVACKIHRLGAHWSKTRQSNFARHACREYVIHKSLIHPGIVRLFDVFDIDQYTFCTILEYCTAGDLEEYLRQKQTLPQRETRFIIKQIVDGLVYLNSQQRPIIHYDLKPANILFDGAGYAKIADFGLAKIMDGGNEEGIDLTSQGAGTYWYLPPECFQPGSKITPKVDVWSCGVITYQMLYGTKPFGNDMSQQNILLGNVITPDMEVEFPAKPVVPQEAKDFIKACLTPEQNKRPDIKTLSQFEFLNIK